ncbi:hypothetical protein P153DRAFT_358553 [Dothidotthia symphoricarpi CBS 119687]|uniref:Uncharacterized protein n=1 Tax=Dothidotthia symphoricarpi CBS 119687 TaxID=1392245 RepID=A0A6A6A6S2_9PLEO|nr:uncharacterized protein P153DRAFT_358553 [Dothidotthia symphoricarpi CBS 119687]KAF2127702.1 hypothetical protein P153DRAFT_358553 [Dothidotthia symphoricarpi CBS 119687]
MLMVEVHGSAVPLWRERGGINSLKLYKVLRPSDVETAGKLREAGIRVSFEDPSLDDRIKIGAQKYDGCQLNTIFTPKTKMRVIDQDMIVYIKLVYSSVLFKGLGSVVAFGSDEVLKGIKGTNNSDGVNRLQEIWRAMKLTKVKGQGSQDRNVLPEEDLFGAIEGNAGGKVKARKGRGPTGSGTGVLRKTKAAATTTME